MRLKVTNSVPPTLSVDDSYATHTLVGLTSEQVHKLHKFVKSDDNEATLEDGWLFQTGLGSGGSHLRVIKLGESVSKDGGLFTVEAKIPRYVSTYKTLMMSDDKDYAYVEIPIGVVLHALHKEIGWA